MRLYVCRSTTPWWQPLWMPWKTVPLMRMGCRSSGSRQRTKATWGGAGVRWVTISACFVSLDCHSFVCRAFGFHDRMYTHCTALYSSLACDRVPPCSLTLRVLCCATGARLDETITGFGGAQREIGQLCDAELAYHTAKDKITKRQKKSYDAQMEVLGLDALPDPRTMKPTEVMNLGWSGTGFRPGLMGLNQRCCWIFLCDSMPVCHEHESLVM